MASLFSQSTLLPLSAAQIVALTLSLLGLVLGFAAILTPSWQIVYAREIEQWIQSGLWLNCQTRPNGMHTCVYSFSNGDLPFYSQSELLNLRSPPFHSWQRPLLWALLGAQLLAFVALLSLCLSFHPPMRRLSAVAFLVCMASAVLLHSGSAITFAFLSQMVEYRFFHVSVSGIYEKQRGYSFFLELAAIAFLAASLLPACLHLFQVFRQSPEMAAKQRQYASRTPPLTMGQFDMRAEEDLTDGVGGGGHFWDEERFAMRQLPPLPPVAYR